MIATTGRTSVALICPVLIFGVRLCEMQIFAAQISMVAVLKAQTYMAPIFGIAF
jgi:hypothetical protein